MNCRKLAASILVATVLPGAWIALSWDAKRTSTTPMPWFEALFWGGLATLAAAFAVVTLMWLVFIVAPAALGAWWRWVKE